MRSIVTLGLVLLALTCLAALVVSTQPGALQDLRIAGALVSLAGIALVGIGGPFAWSFARRRRAPIREALPWRRAVFAFALLGTTYVLIKLYVPRRIAFSLSRSAFEAHLSKARETGADSHLDGERLGIFAIAAIAADPRGGTYFCVGRVPDGLGPDRVSYGFVHEPNAIGSPFGAASYRVYPLGADWYWFRASDDR